MITIEKEIGLDYAHRLLNHESLCSNLHGHRARILIGIEGELITKGSSQDMVIDFKDLKQILNEKIMSQLDHTCIASVEDKILSDFLIQNNQRYLIIRGMPTAENLAKWCFDEIKEDIEKLGCKVAYVKFYETPTSEAIYTKEMDNEEIGRFVR